MATGIATRYGMDGPGIETWWGWVFRYSCWAALRQSQPPSKCVAGVFPGGKVAVTWLYWLNASGHTVALRSIQPLTGMSTRDLSRSKGGRCVRLTTLPLPYIEFLKCIEASTSWCPRGLPRFLQRKLFLLHKLYSNNIYLVLGMSLYRRLGGPQRRS